MGKSITLRRPETDVESWQFYYDCNRLDKELERELEDLKHSLKYLGKHEFEISRHSTGILIEDEDEVVSYIEYGWTMGGTVGFQANQPWADDYNFYDVEFCTIQDIANQIWYTINVHYIAKACREV